MIRNTTMHKIYERTLMFSAYLFDSAEGNEKRINWLEHVVI